MILPKDASATPNEGASFSGNLHALPVIGCTSEPDDRTYYQRTGSISFFVFFFFFFVLVSFFVSSPLRARRLCGEICAPALYPSGDASAGRGSPAGRGSQAGPIALAQQARPDDSFVLQLSGARPCPGPAPLSAGRSISSGTSTPAPSPPSFRWRAPGSLGMPTRQGEETGECTCWRTESRCPYRITTTGIRLLSRVPRRAA